MKRGWVFGLMISKIPVHGQFACHSGPVTKELFMSGVCGRAKVLTSGLEVEKNKEVGEEEEARVPRSP